MDIITLAKNHNWNLPISCPVCGSSLILSENHKQFSCRNDNCKSRYSGRIDKWTRVLGIKELGLKTIERFIDEGIVSTISSLYTMNYSDIENLDGFGKRSAENIKKEIESHKKMSISQFIAGYNIEDCGEKVIKKIADAKGLKSLNSFINSKVSDFVCDGVGEITAKKLYEGIKAFNFDMLETSKYIEIIEEKKEEVVLSSSNLGGKSFCFTGAASRPRKELQKLVTDNGGVVFDGVKKGLDYLVIADPTSTSSKAQKARKEGVNLISEEDFVKMCGSN